MKLSELSPDEVQIESGQAETPVHGGLRLSDLHPSEYQVEKPSGIDLGPGSKAPDEEVTLAPNQPVNAISKSLYKHGDLQIVNHPIESAKAVGRETLEGFKNIGRSALAANKQAGDVIFHPSLVANPQFRAETMRGVNDFAMPIVGNKLV